MVPKIEDGNNFGVGIQVSEKCVMVPVDKIPC